MLCTSCLRGLAKTAIRPHTAQPIKLTLSAAPRRYPPHIPSPSPVSSKPNLTIPTPHRTLLTRPPLRPSIGPLSPFSTPTPTTIPTNLTATTTSTTHPDLLPKISTHPSLAGIQVRNGPRNTYDPSHFVRKRRHGFLARKRSRTGRAILLRRRAKRRGVLSH